LFHIPLHEPVIGKKSKQTAIMARIENNLRWKGRLRNIVFPFLVTFIFVALGANLGVRGRTPSDKGGSIAQTAKIRVSAEKSPPNATNTPTRRATSLYPQPLPSHVLGVISK